MALKQTMIIREVPNEVIIDLGERAQFNIHVAVLTVLPHVGGATLPHQSRTSPALAKCIMHIMNDIKNMVLC